MIYALLMMFCGQTVGCGLILICILALESIFLGICNAETEKKQTNLFSYAQLPEGYGTCCRYIE